MDDLNTGLLKVHYSDVCYSDPRCISFSNLSADLIQVLYDNLDSRAVCANLFQFGRLERKSKKAYKLEVNLTFNPKFDFLGST